MSEILSSETFLNVYRKRLKESIAREKDFAFNAVSSHEEYAERVGFVRGVEEALALFDETERKFFPRY